MPGDYPRIFKPALSEEIMSSVLVNTDGLIAPQIDGEHFEFMRRKVHGPKKLARTPKGSYDLNTREALALDLFLTLHGYEFIQSPDMTLPVEFDFSVNQPAYVEVHTIQIDRLYLAFTGSEAALIYDLRHGYDITFLDTMFNLCLMRRYEHVEFYEEDLKDVSLPEYGVTDRITPIKKAA